MLKRLDHIVLICRDFEAACADYSLLFGAAPNWASKTEQTQAAIFKTGNTALEILGAVPETKTSERFDQLLGASNAALTSLAFETGDINQAHHILGRRGLKPSDIDSGKSCDITSNRERTWERFRLEDDSCAGIKTFVLQNTSEKLAGDAQNGLALDHLVINTPNPERAIAHYAGRLGIRFALDRTIESFNTRFLFFKLENLVLEVIHKIDQAQAPENPDNLWGLTWKVDDLDLARNRLKKSDVTVSAIRTGRKPGSQVFTAKSHTSGIPTLFIAHNRT